MRGVDCYVVDGPEEIEAKWLEDKLKISVASGASAPEILEKHGSTVSVY